MVIPPMVAEQPAPPDKSAMCNILLLHAVARLTVKKPGEAVIVCGVLGTFKVPIPTTITLLDDDAAAEMPELPAAVFAMQRTDLKSLFGSSYKPNTLK